MFFTTPGTVDESTRLSALNRSFFYILVDGECLVIKDGKQVRLFCFPYNKSDFALN